MAGLTQASSVIAAGQVQRGRVGDRDPGARAVEAERLAVLPAVAQVAFATVPVVPFPDASATVVPDPSSNAYAATNPDVAAGVVEAEISANASATSTTTNCMAGRRGNDSTVVTPASFTGACSSSRNLECLLILPRIKASQRR